MRRQLTAQNEIAPRIARAPHGLVARMLVPFLLLLSACGSIDYALQTRVEAEADQLSPQVDEEAVQEIGLCASSIMELLVYPAIFFVWGGWNLTEEGDFGDCEETPAGCARHEPRVMGT